MREYTKLLKFKKFERKKEKKNGRKVGCRIAKKFLVADAVLVALVGTTYVVNATQYHTRFLSGTYINGNYVGDKTVDEVKKMIEPRVENYQLTLTMRNGTSETIKGSDIDFSYTPGNELQDALSKQNSFSWIAGALGSTDNLEIKTPVSFDKDKLNQIIASWPEMNDSNVTKPVNAHVEVGDDNKAKVVAEVEGDELDQNKVLKAVTKAFSELETNVNLDKAGAYKTPVVRKDSDQLKNNVDEVNKYLATKITFNGKNSDSKQVLDATTTKTWLISNMNNGKLLIDDTTLNQKASEWAAAWASSDDNYGNSRTFKSTNYGNVQIGTTALHGHALDQNTIVSEVISDLTKKAGEVSHDTPYTHYEDDKDPQLGGHYVEVDVEAQKVYVYENYQLVYATSCVTGKEYKTPTPSGIYSVFMMEKNAALTGPMGADGTPTYVSHVSYWMPFHGGYGLHDAPWRYGHFGGSIYKYSGSHGCVNLPVDAAPVIWSHVSKGTPVVVFRASNATGGKVDRQGEEPASQS